MNMWAAASAPSCSFLTCPTSVYPFFILSMSHRYRPWLSSSADRKCQRCAGESTAPELLPELSGAPSSLPALRALTHSATINRDADSPHSVLPRPARSVHRSPDKHTVVLSHNDHTGAE